jgi:hypothetical protein
MWNAVVLGVIFGVAGGIATGSPFIGIGFGVAMFAAFYGKGSRASDDSEVKSAPDA